MDVRDEKDRDEKEPRLLQLCEPKEALPDRNRRKGCATMQLTFVRQGQSLTIHEERQSPPPKDVLAKSAKRLSATKATWVILAGGDQVKGYRAIDLQHDFGQSWM